MFVPNAEPAAIVLHADTTFTARERVILEDATARIRAATDGYVRIALLYDFDFGNIRTLRALQRAPALLRTLSRAVAAEHDVALRGETLGFTTTSGPRRVFLVVDRLGSSRLFVHVAMHELLHAVGVRHVDDRGAVMHPTTDGRDPPVALKPADLAGIARALREARGTVTPVTPVAPAPPLGRPSR